MTSFRPLVLMLLAATMAGAAACHRSVPPPPAPAALEENHCWWAVFRSPLSPDSVAAHFVRAFDELGLHGATWTQRGDTAWAHAQPTRLDGWSGGTFSARLVAVRMGDSTHFRHFVGVAARAGGWPAAHDSVTTDGRHLAINPAGAGIGFCGALGRAAQVHGTAPADPDGEEKLGIWTRPSPEE